MIYVVITDTQEQFVKAYFLAVCLNTDTNRILPVSNDQMSELCKQTLIFLKTDYTYISFNTLLKTKTSLLSEEDALYFNKINSNNQLSDIAYFKTKIVFEDNKKKRGALDHCSAYVVSLSQTISQQAIQYALLMNRSLILIKSFEEVNQLFSLFEHASSYFISFSDDLDMLNFVDFLDKKNKNNNNVPFAIMYPYGDIEREFFVIKTFLFTISSYPYKYKNSFHFPLEQPNFSFQGENAHLYLGQHSNLDELELVLTQPLNLLFSMSHSNGVDMGLGRIVLCPRENEPLLGNSDVRAMPCFFDLELCSRKTANNKIIKLNKLKAYIAFFYTCWGILLKNGLYDTTVSFARQLVLSPCVGTIISTYTMSHLDNSIISRFFNYIQKNLTISEVIKKLNAQHYKAYLDNPHTLIILGDPELKLNQMFVSDFSEMFPDKVSSHLIEKGIIKFEKFILNTNEICLNLTIGQIITDILYTKTVVLGSKSLSSDQLNTLLDGFMMFLDKFWIFLLLIKKRLSQADKHPVNHDIILNELSKSINKYHKYWVDYFITMNTNFGGLVRLQIDRYFDEKNKFESSENVCPYCSGNFVENELSLIEHEQLTRRVFECYSCTTIFDSNAIFTFGTIICDKFWIKNNAPKLLIQLSSLNFPKGEFKYTLCVCLEPFYKKGQPNISSIVKTNYINISDKNAQIIEIEVDDFVLLDMYTTGQYYLNVMISVQTSISFLRRSIYVKNQ